MHNFAPKGIDYDAIIRILAAVNSEVQPLAVCPKLAEFKELALQGNVIPVYAQLAADYETPVSAFSKIAGEGQAFLFESAEVSNVSGRYSILGSNPKTSFVAHGKDITFSENGETKSWTAEQDVLAELEKLM